MNDSVGVEGDGESVPLGWIMAAQVWAWTVSCVGGAALFRYVNALAEWTTLGLLTVERCVDLGRSRGARFFRPRPTLLFIAGIWVGSVLLQLAALTQIHMRTIKLNLRVNNKRHSIHIDGMRN
ncbi:hypothetical protein E2C01_048954 [Portunus trituberculatus]|uniref:Transmembrane protein n=1 Tax=Portunus trituberculatus TaxID=210409 RepID=A0A5B7G7X4_PORTR|nr:hypothetical protein [Portunus trituberculatus]